MIDADGIRKKAVPHTRGNYGYSADIRKWAVLVGDIDDAPTIDAVPVVRCRECKNHCDTNGKHYCKFWRMYCPDDSDFFCKAGKREEGAGNV